MSTMQPTRNCCCSPSVAGFTAPVVATAVPLPAAQCWLGCNVGFGTTCAAAIRPAPCSPRCSSAQLRYTAATALSGYDLLRSLVMRSSLALPSSAMIPPSRRAAASDACTKTARAHLSHVWPGLEHQPTIKYDYRHAMRVRTCAAPSLPPMQSLRGKLALAALVRLRSAAP